MLKKIKTIINYKSAFTLSELLIALGVIAILTAVTMPIVSNMLPDQNVLMAKRAFYTTETIVSNLINDDFCYPKQKSKVGFDDGLAYSRCEKWKFIEGQAEKNDIKKKFLTLFSDKLDIKDVSEDLKTIYTKDGMKWIFSNTSTFTNNNKESHIDLTVDVNGDKDPNCGQETLSTKCSDTERKNGFDRFSMEIYANGKIKILDCWAKMSVRTDKKLTGKNDFSDCSSL